MFCPECGSQVERSYKFCPECGFKLSVFPQNGTQGKFTSKLFFGNFSVLFAVMNLG